MEKIMQAELFDANRELVARRQARLKALYRADYAGWQTELADKGLALSRDQD